MTRTRRTDDRPGTDRGAHASRFLVVALVALALTVPGSAVASAAGSGSGPGSAKSVGSIVPAAEHAPQAADESFVVSLEDDGDATAAIVVQFDLTDEADREAFEALRANETKRSELETRTERRFRSIADGAAAETDREMTIEDASASFETVDGGDRGIVTVSVAWSGFAATEADGDRLTLSEPLASGFAADQPVVLELPEGYALERATPAPSERTAEQVRWDADASLDGFEAVVAPESAVDSGSGTDSDGGDSQPAPGFVAVPPAIGAGVWLHRRT